MTASDLDRIRAEAYAVLRTAYFDDVGNCAEKLLEDIEQGRLKGRLSTVLDRTLKNHPRVTEKLLAQETMLYSVEDGSALEEIGMEDAVQEGRINWIALASVAFKRDVEDVLFRISEGLWTECETAAELRSALRGGDDDED
jgi:hypothetical protein